MVCLYCSQTMLFNVLRHCRCQIGRPESQQEGRDGLRQNPQLCTWILCRGAQLAEVLTDSLKLALLQAEVPTRFKKSTIIAVPKKAYATCINDDCPVPLTSIVMNKTKELIIDFRKKGGEHTAIYINGTEVERVEGVKFLGILRWNFLSLAHPYNVEAGHSAHQVHIVPLKNIPPRT
eukprot:g48526.t1